MPVASRLLVVLALVIAGCSTDEPVERATVETTTPSTSSAETTVEATTTTTAPVNPRPEWLGTRVLPLRPDGLGEIQPTPPELVDRRFATVDVLPRPDHHDFFSDVALPSDAVIARSTWSPECPVDVSDLRYVTLPFWGFDGLTHTGELLVHADAVDSVVAGFRHLHERRFPIEEMRVVTRAELDLPPIDHEGARDQNDQSVEPLALGEDGGAGAEGGEGGDLEQVPQLHVVKPHVPQQHRRQPAAVRVMQLGVVAARVAPLPQELRDDAHGALALHVVELPRQRAPAQHAQQRQSHQQRMMPEELAPNWQAVLDPNGSGHHYYYNSQTQATTWHKPVA